MAALLDQLRQLHRDLERLAERDPDQEVTGVAVPLIDAVISEARANLPEGSTLGSQIVEIISPAAVLEEEVAPIRAADALVVVGQLLAVYQHAEDQKPNSSISSPARFRLDQFRKR
jgi:hypothetical protein